MTPRLFGHLADGSAVEKYILRNAAGASLEVISYGAVVTALRVPDRHGQLADVVLGFDHLDDYVANRVGFGAIIGRIAGRLSGGKLILPDGTRQLACNEGRNHLHGGAGGFDRRNWTASPAPRADGADSLRLTYHSPDGEEGYPGNLTIALTYTLTAQNEFVVESEATTDRVTVLSLAQHSYFNLAGEGSGDVLNHTLQLFSTEYIPVSDAGMTLSGVRTPVAGTANDFTSPRRLGDALPGIYRAHGENYLLRPVASAEPAPVARVVDPVSGRVLSVASNDCCVQFYSGMALNGKLTGKSGRAYGPHAALCLECQGYPDGAHRPDLGDILVHPGVPQRRTTTYAFSTL